MRTKVREVDGIDWNAGAVCNAAWTGVLLSDILASAGITTRDIKIAHVWFDSAVSKTQDDDYYGVSIPLERCLDPDYKVMLALEMNGAPLSVEHGAPVRAVIPGVAGARWTKWVTRIVVAEVESQNFYQQRDYKILPEWVRSKAQAKGEWAKHPAMMGLTINSVVGVPESGSVVRHGRGLEVGGYALPAGDDGPVVQVEVSMDGGESWREADICWPSKAEREKDGGRAVRWAWAIWKLRLEKEEVEMLAEREEWRKGEGKVLSRAKDKGGNYQDGTVPWNFRGVGYNAYGESERLRIAEVVDEERQRKGTASIGVKL